MNFLEQLTAEWFAYRGYFVRTNVKFGKRPAGGWSGELDVLAVLPKNSETVHIETSMDADSWPQRRARFSRKFQNAEAAYRTLAGFVPERISRIAVVGFGRTAPGDEEWSGIVIQSIFQFVGEILDDLEHRHPMKEAVPESYPLLRALQFGAYVSKERQRDRERGKPTSGSTSEN